ncbi:putative reverse transcriptase domain-containing protein [Tanacetum coccineum]
MPPRRFKKKSVRKIVEKRVAKAIEKYEKTRADSNNTGGSGSTNTRGTVVPEMHGCSYKTFMNGKPHSFKGTEGVVTEVGSKRWSKCSEIAINVKAMMTTEYCPATEIQRMEQELWTLTLKGDDIEAYNNRFHELALMCHELVPTEKKKIERYVRGFPERIKGNITSSKPATLHDAINMARELVEQSVQRPSWRKDLCWKFTKMQPVQLTSSWTVSSKVPEMSKIRTFQDNVPKAGTIGMMELRRESLRVG